MTRRDKPIRKHTEEDESAGVEFLDTTDEAPAVAQHPDDACTDSEPRRIELDDGSDREPYEPSEDDA